MPSRSELRALEWADPVIRAKRRASISEAAKRRYTDPQEREAAASRARAQNRRLTPEQRQARDDRLRVQRQEQPDKQRGLSRSSEYKVWQAMHQRCENPKHVAYKDYGGRGIKVCEAWSGSAGFLAFYENVGPRPSDAHTIGRIDNDGDYAPGNVRWETRLEQAGNRRTSRAVTIGGETLHLSEWARRIGVDPPVLAYRIERGWSDEQLLEPPKLGKQRVRPARQV